MGSALKNRQLEVDSSNIRVAVAMSGGVDSSVAASLLVREGYDVVGLTMKLFDHSTTGADPQSHRGYFNLDAVHRAEAVCHTLNIPHYSLDLMDDFKDYIINDFIIEYIEGRTPNPCVRCNAYLKWGTLLDEARLLGCDKLATGHYARIEQVGNEFRLLRAADSSKDQAYALWGTPVRKLSSTLFPLGSLTKERVREIAAQLGLKTAATPESQEICFIPEGHYAEFLKVHNPSFFESIRSGELVEEREDHLERVGSHPGYPFYTVGQRRGLGGGYPEPRYVLRVVPENNRVVIGERERLLERSFVADQLNWLIPVPQSTVRAEVQVRYRSGAAPASLRPEDICEGFIVEFDQPVEAITPGQSAVFFQGDRLIGGGRIREVLHQRQ